MLLGKIAEEFGLIPWENLTKFIKKHDLAAKDDSSADSCLRAQSHLFAQTSGQGVPAFSEFPHLKGIDLSGEQVDSVSRLRLSEEVISDYVKYGSGGTCFSLTNALRIITTDLGFTVYPAMADMKHGANIHCALIAIIDGERYLIDPGYLVVEPVPLKPGMAVSVKLPGHTISYLPVEGMDAFDLYTSNSRGEDVFRYRVRPVPVPEEEFLGHWIASFSTNGMNGLHVNGFSREGRKSAHNFNMRVDDGLRKKNIKLKQDYVGKVSHHFGISSEIVETAFLGWKRLLCRE